MSNENFEFTHVTLRDYSDSLKVREINVEIQKDENGERFFTHPDNGVKYYPDRGMKQHLKISLMGTPKLPEIDGMVCLSTDGSPNKGFTIGDLKERLSYLSDKYDSAYLTLSKVVVGDKAGILIGAFRGNLKCDFMSAKILTEEESEKIIQDPS